MRNFLALLKFKFKDELELKIGFPLASVNRTAHIRHQCRKTAVLSCYRFLINSGVKKMNNI